MSESSSRSDFRQFHGPVRERSLREQLLRGGVGSAAIQAMNRVLALASGIVLARVLGVEGYGIYAYAFALMSLLAILAEAGMPVLLMRDVAATQAHERWSELRGLLQRGLRLVSCTALTVMTFGLSILWLLRSSIDDDRFLTMLFMLLVLPIAAVSKTITGTIKGLHRVVLGRALESLVQPALMLGLVAALFTIVPTWRTPQSAMLIQLMSVSALFVASLYWLRRALPKAARNIPATHPPRGWVRSAIPFTLIGGAGIINTQADLIMLGWFRPVEDVGIYRVTSQGAVLVGFLLQAAAAVAGPHFASFYANSDLHRIRKLLNKIASLVVLGSLPMVVLFVFFGSEVLTLLFGEAYSSGHRALAILSIGYLANIAFGPVGMLLQMVGQESGTAKVLWLTAVLNIVLNLLLIPVYGTVGAAIATAMSVTLYHLLLRILIRRRLGI